MTEKISIQNLTNCRFIPSENVLLIKKFGENNYISLPYYKKFFSKAGLFSDAKDKFRVFKSVKKEYFSKEEVDLIEVLDYSYLKTFERVPENYLYLYDLSVEYFFVVYEDVKFSDKYTIGYLDIETNDDLNADVAASEILIISLLIDNEMKTFRIDEYKSESAMLKDFFEYICSKFPDVIFGWNVVEFDYKYILNRCKRLRVSLSRELQNRFLLIDFINSADIFLKMFGYSIIKQTEGLSLNSVCEYFLKKGKLKLKDRPGKVFKENPDLVVRYNQNDIKLVKELTEDLNLFSFILNLQKISSVFLRDVFYNSFIIDTMILKKFNDFVFPSKKRIEEREEYEGGYVFNPPVGIFENVLSFDFSGMYPSIIMTFNISPDSKAKTNYDYQIDGVGFKKEPSGIFKIVIEDLMKERLRLKKLLSDTSLSKKKKTEIDVLQSAYKTVLNSFYGVCAYRGFRLFDTDLAKTITGMGRKLLKIVKSELEKSNYGVVLYGDTDSFYIKTDKAVDEILCKIDEILRSYLKVYGITENFLKVELHNSFEKIMFFGKKKKYIGRTKDRELFIKGFDTEKYDTPRIIRQFMKEIIHKVFDSEIVNVNDFFEKLRQNSLLEDFVIYKRLNKEESSYKVEPLHLKAIKWTKENLSSYVSDELFQRRMVPLFYAKVNSIPKLITFDVDSKFFPSNIELDYEKYFLFFIIKKMLDVYFIYGLDKVIGFTDYVYKRADEKILKNSERLMDNQKKFEYIINKIWSLDQKETELANEYETNRI